MVYLPSNLILLIGLLALLGTATSFWLFLRLRNLEARLNILASKLTKDRDQHAPAPVEYATGTIIQLADRDRTQIAVEEILYLRAEAGGVQYHTRKGVYFGWQSLKTSLEQLPQQSFIQVNRSTAVSLQAVTQQTPKGLLLIDGTEILRSPVFQINASG